MALVGAQNTNRYGNFFIARYKLLKSFIAIAIFIGY